MNIKTKIKQNINRPRIFFRDYRSCTFFLSRGGGGAKLDLFKTTVIWLCFNGYLDFAATLKSFWSRERLVLFWGRA